MRNLACEVITDAAYNQFLQDWHKHCQLDAYELRKGPTLPYIVLDNPI